MARYFGVVAEPCQPVVTSINSAIRALEAVGSLGRRFVFIDKPSDKNQGTTMRADILIAICSASLFLGQSGVDALECYVCNSYTDSRCSEKVPHSSLLQKCDLVPGAGAKYTMCRKTVQTIEFRVNGLPPETRVIRTCGYDESNYKGKCYQRGGFGGRQEVCSCLTDKCNSATTILDKAPHTVLMFMCIIGAAIRTFTWN